MKKKYRLFVLAVASIGVIAQLYAGVTSIHKFQTHVYFTFQSNLLCMIMAFLLYISKDDSKYVVMEFLTSVWITITCLVANVLLFNPFTVVYWLTLHNPFVHLFTPVVFVLGFLLYSDRGAIKKWIPLLCVTYPYIYVLIILIRAYILKSTMTVSALKDMVLYPYFFLDASTLGYLGVMIWVGILTVIFVGLGFVYLYIYNHTKRAS